MEGKCEGACRSSPAAGSTENAVPANSGVPCTESPAACPPAGAGLTPSLPQAAGAGDAEPGRGTVCEAPAPAVPHHPAQGRQGPDHRGLRAGGHLPGQARGGPAGRGGGRRSARAEGAGGPPGPAWAAPGGQGAAPCVSPLSGFEDSGCGVAAGVGGPVSAGAGLEGTRHPRVWKWPDVRVFPGRNTSVSGCPCVSGAGGVGHRCSQRPPCPPPAVTQLPWV